MQSPEQISKTLMEHTREIGEMQSSISSAHKRINDMTDLVQGMHKISANLESLTLELRNLANDVKTGLREQGKRIGEVESAMVKITNFESEFRVVKKDVDDIKLAPAKKWNHVIMLFISAIVAFLVGYLSKYFSI